MSDDDDLKALVQAVHEARLRLACEIARSRRLLEQNQHSAAQMKDAERRLKALLARMQTPRSVN
jgi:hypothetical protein